MRTEGQSSVRNKRLWSEVLVSEYLAHSIGASQSIGAHRSEVPSIEAPSIDVPSIGVPSIEVSSSGVPLSERRGLREQDVRRVSIPAPRGEPRDCRVLTAQGLVVATGVAATHPSSSHAVWRTGVASTPTELPVSPTNGTNGESSANGGGGRPAGSPGGTAGQPRSATTATHEFGQ